MLDIFFLVFGFLFLGVWFFVVFLLFVVDFSLLIFEALNRYNKEPAINMNRMIAAITIFVFSVANTVRL